MIASISLSSYRVSKFENIIESLLNQTLKPEKIEVFYSKEKFFLDEGIKNLPDLPVEYNKVENIGLLRNFIPCLKKYWNKDVKILVMDDDRMYHKTNLKTYESYSEKYPNKALGFWGWSYKKSKGGNHVLNSSYIKKPVYTDVIIPSCGVLIKPSFFTKEDVWNWEKYNTNEIDVRISDETFLSYLMAKNGIDRILVPCQRIPKRTDKKDKKKITNRGTSYYKKKVKPSKNNQRKTFRKILESKAWKNID